jgi:hypothetical protein
MRWYEEGQWKFVTSRKFNKQHNSKEDIDILCACTVTEIISSVRIMKAKERPVLLSDYCLGILLSLMEVI